MSGQGSRQGYKDPWAPKDKTYTSKVWSEGPQNTRPEDDDEKGKRRDQQSKNQNYTDALAGAGESAQDRRHEGKARQEVNKVWNEIESGVDKALGIAKKDKGNK